MSAYRQSPFANLTPVVKNLLIINLICFIPYIILSNASYQRLIIDNLGVFYFNSPKFRAWQIITYMFLHGGWIHIIFNMFALFSFGPILEYAIGSKRFFNLYFICGIGAIILQWIIQAYEVHAITGGITIPFHFGPDDQSVPLQIREIYHVPLVGASGAIFGVLVAFAMLYPNLELMIMFIPVPIKAKYIIPAYILFELWSSINPGAGDDVAHLAHIGGALFGFILIKIWRLR
jgi:membrane associated rhomboid family serine protease